MPPAPHGRGNHGSGSAKRRRKGHGGGHEEEGGSERWLVTYADMLTLLLVLFIVLFSVSVVNTSKFISLKTSLAAVFGNGSPGIGSGGVGVANQMTGIGGQVVVPDITTAKQHSGKDSTAGADNKAAKAAQEKADFTKIRAELQKALERAGLDKDVRFAINGRGLVITVVTNALVFPGNSAQLLARGQEILAIIAPPLSHETREIEVDGYTNQLKVSTGPYPSGWELSSARASAVVRYLSAHRVPESKLSAVGWSDQHPLYPASDPRSVTLNRRVEIVVLSALTTPSH